MKDDTHKLLADVAHSDIVMLALGLLLAAIGIEGGITHGNEPCSV